jgi:hypothetical protein
MGRESLFLWKQMVISVIINKNIFPKEVKEGRERVCTAYGCEYLKKV